MKKILALLLAGILVFSIAGCGNGDIEAGPDSTDNWEEDASRRDLTINAVYADENGNVFDYYNGIEDLEKGIEQANKILNSKNKDEILNDLKKNNKL